MTEPDPRDSRSGARTYNGPFGPDDVCQCGHHVTEHRHSEVGLTPGECATCNDPALCPGYAWREGRVEAGP